MHDFTPTVWPADKTPDSAIDCSKCELCMQRSEIIWGEGNPTAPILLVLDNPGARKNKDGIEYVCGTRQTLQQAAFQVGLGMNDIYATFILKCRPLRKYDKELARETCSGYLKEQIADQNPTLALCMGNVSLQWFSGNMDAEVKTYRGYWHIFREIPTLATYHPLAVRRRPNLSNIFMQDWRMLAQRYFEINKNNSGAID